MVIFEPIPLPVKAHEKRLHGSEIAHFRAEKYIPLGSKNLDYFSKNFENKKYIPHGSWPNFGQKIAREPIKLPDLG